MKRLIAALVLALVVPTGAQAQRSADSTPTMLFRITVPAANVREAPTTKSPVVATVRDTARSFVVLGERSGWVLVALNGDGDEMGWIYGELGKLEALRASREEAQSAPSTTLVADVQPAPASAEVTEATSARTVADPDFPTGIGIGVTQGLLTSTLAGVVLSVRSTTVAFSVGLNSFEAYRGEVIYHGLIPTFSFGRGGKRLLLDPYIGVGVARLERNLLKREESDAGFLATAGLLGRAPEEPRGVAWLGVRISRSDHPLWLSTVELGARLFPF